MVDRGKEGGNGEKSSCCDDDKSEVTACALPWVTWPHLDTDRENNVSPLVGNKTLII